jgi:DNA ligase (NAD+)
MEGQSIRCRNADCSARASRQALHFASVCLSGANMGPAVVKALLDADVVRDAGDFFEVCEEQLLQLPRFGGKRTATLLKGIEAAKAMPLATLLTGLGIAHVGARTAKDLAAAFETAEGLQVCVCVCRSFRPGPQTPTNRWWPSSHAQGATLDAVQAIPGVGDVIAQSVVSWFSETDNRLLLQKLRRAGVACVREPSPAPATTGACRRRRHLLSATC